MKLPKKEQLLNEAVARPSEGPDRLGTVAGRCVLPAIAAWTVFSRALRHEFIRFAGKILL